MQTAALQKKTTTSTNSHTQKGSATLPAGPVYQQKPIQKMELEEEQPMQAKLVTQLKADITAAPPPTENIDNNNSGTAQLKELEEEMPLQGKFIVQKKGLEDELPMQGKFIAQRMELEEEQPIQGKFIIQRKEKEEQVPLQPKIKIPSSAPTEPKPFQRFALPKNNEPEAVQAPIQRFVLPTQPIQKKANNTGLPENLKAGVENLSGFSMDDVKVHYNSAKPAQLQAHAYAQGTDIHIGPRQEQHLPHEAWHVVQQKQGRVQPTLQMKGGIAVNDDKGLEGEADVMGAKAVQMSEYHSESKNNLRFITPPKKSAQLVIEGYQAKTKLTERHVVMNGLDAQQQAFMHLLHTDTNSYSQDYARKYVGAQAIVRAVTHGAPFPFRFTGVDDAMDTVVNNEGGFVQYPTTGLPERSSGTNQTSLVVGSDYNHLSQTSHRAKSQVAVMGNISPNKAAVALGLPEGAYEWLHLVAFSIKQTHVSNLSMNSLKLIHSTNQPQQIRENIVLGTAGANTAMLTYETLIKSFLRENPNWTVDLFVNADVQPAIVNGVSIPIANRIDFHFQMRTGTGEITPPVILAFNPRDPAAPSLAEYANVVSTLKAFLTNYHTQIAGFRGLGHQGFTPV